MDSKHADASLISSLGHFAHHVKLATTPELVRTQGKLSILDTVGCVVSGGQDPDALVYLEVEKKMSQSRESLVFCTDIRLNPEAATRVNAFMGDIFELNDILGGHAGISNVTAGIALAEATGATGAELLEAVIAGIEVTTRVYTGFIARMKPFTETGMIPVGIPATFGVAATASRLLRLTEAQTTQAIAIAGALAGWNPAEVFFGNGGSIKPMVIGAWPGSVGILAARYAAAGMSGPERILESKVGYYATVSTGIDYDAVLDRSLWYLSRPKRKMHACCAFIHSSVEAMARLRRERAPLADAHEIRIAIPPQILPAVGKSAVPTTVTETRFSALYCAALAAVEADVIGVEHSFRFQSYLDRADVQDLMKRIRIVADPALPHYYHAIVTLHDKSGAETHRAENHAPKGSPENPMSDDEVRDKFRRLTREQVDGDMLERYIARMDRLENEPGTDWIASLSA